MEDDKVKEILDEQIQQQAQQQKHQQKKSFWNNKKTVKGKALSAWLIVMVTIFMLFTFGIGMYFGKELFSEKGNGSKPSSQSNTNTTDTTDNKDSKKDDVDYSSKTFDLSNFDPTKIINSDSNMKYSKNVSEISNNFQDYYKAELLPDKKNVKVTIDFNKIFNNLYGKDTSFGTKEYNVSFNRNVKKVYISGWGQGFGNEKVYYLMDDGTIEYTPLTNVEINPSSLNPDTFSVKSYGPIPNVKDVVIMATGDIVPVDSPYGGGLCVLGIKENGEFYDISSMNF